MRPVHPAGHLLQHRGRDAQARLAAGRRRPAARRLPVVRPQRARSATAGRARDPEPVGARPGRCCRTSSSSAPRRRARPACTTTWTCIPRSRCRTTRRCGSSPTPTTCHGSVATRRTSRPGPTYRGESTPQYTKWPIFPGVVDRMADLMPDARLIYLVRDPVERAIAEYVEEATWGVITEDIEAALADADAAAQPDRRAEPLRHAAAGDPSALRPGAGAGRRPRRPAGRPAGHDAAGSSTSSGWRRSSSTRRRCGRATPTATRAPSRAGTSALRRPALIRLAHKLPTEQLGRVRTFVTPPDQQAGRAAGAERGDPDAAPRRARARGRGAARRSPVWRSPGGRSEPSPDLRRLHCTPCRASATCRRTSATTSGGGCATASRTARWSARCRA